MKQFWIASLSFALSLCAHADVRLANIFGDHMVLQRKQAIAVWGWAREGESVRVSLHGQRAISTANAQGLWRVTLKAEAAGGPYVLEVQGDNTLRVNDVLVGDVWFASGQSNMEWTVGQSNDAAREVAQSANAKIRHIKITHTVSFQPAPDIAPAGWKISGPADAGDFTAAGYFFAQKLQRDTGIPIGIVNSSWGGTNVETWISRQALSALPEFHMNDIPADVQSARSRYAQRMNALVQSWQHAPIDDASASSQWKKPEFDDQSWATLNAPQYWEEQGLDGLDGVVWYRRDVYLNEQQVSQPAILDLGTVDDCDETFVNGKLVGHLCEWDAQRHYELPAGVLHPGRNVIAVRVVDTGGGGGFYGNPAAMKLSLGGEAIALSGTWRARVESYLDKGDPSPNDLPTLLFNGMVHPLKDFAIRGVIWYQGEANVDRAQQYAQTFSSMITDWRAQWRQPRLPFYFVQLASFLPLEKNTLMASPWAELRDAQRQALNLPSTGMVVATDVGNANDIHPRNKQAIGQRLALLALKNDYGKSKLVASGPSLRGARVRGNTIELSFSDAARGLAASAKSEPLRGFTIAGEDQKFVPALSRIVGSKVLVFHPDIAHPKAVRYGWVDNPEQSNLVNSEGLPASPFRTDNWPWKTAGVKYRF